MLWWTLRRLRSKDPERRRLAARELLLSRPGPEAIEPLIIALRDPDWMVRRGAGDALERLEYKPADQSQEAVMHIAFQRWNDAVTLGSVAIEPFIGVFKDSEHYVRTAAAEALGKIGSSAVEPLIAALKDANGNVRSGAAEALGRIGDVRAVEPLIAALNDSNGNVRAPAAEALGRIDTERAVEPLIAALKDSEDIVRRDAAKALGRTGDVRAVEPLIAALKDSREDLDRHGLTVFGVRSSTTEALGKIGSTAVEPLITALKDSDVHVRLGAAKALGRIGDVRAVEALVATLKDSEKNVRRYAAEALEALKSEPSDQYQQAQPMSKSEVSSASALDAISIPAGTQHYSNRDWGFELDYPADWTIQVENDPAGSWTAAVIIVGSASSGGRPSIIVNTRRGPVLAGGGGGFSQVYVVGADGLSPQLPKTTQEFIERAKKDLARSFRRFHLLSSDETKIADGPAAQMVYSYDGGLERIQEMCITRFGTFVTFQFICEVPANNFPAVEPVFKRIIDSFRLMS